MTKRLSKNLKLLHAHCSPPDDRVPGDKIDDYDDDYNEDYDYHYHDSTDFKMRQGSLFIYAACYKKPKIILRTLRSNVCQKVFDWYTNAICCEAFQQATSNGYWISVLLLILRAHP